MVTVIMDCEKILILSFKKTLTHFLADLECLFGCNLPR